MSGRVRWQRVARTLHESRQLVCDGVRHGRVSAIWGGWFGPATLLGWYAREFRTGDGRREPRRSDVRRWLLARAAGLAEVPTASKPRGWREVVINPALGKAFVRFERNRRRR